MTRCGRSIGLTVFLVFLSSGLSIGDGLNPQDILQKVEETMNAAKGIRVDFEEIYEWKQTGEKQSLKGELILNGQRQFRVTTQDQIIVSDGVTLWTFSKPANRVLIDRLEQTDNTLLPQQLFFSYKKDYQAKLAKDETVDGATCSVVFLSSAKKDLYITQIKAWIEKDKWIPKKIEQTDLSKNKIIYILRHVEINIPVDPGTFQFVVPEGSEVIKL